VGVTRSTRMARRKKRGARWGRGRGTVSRRVRGVAGHGQETGNGLCIYAMAAKRPYAV
jgi:hypothetical protein